MNGAVVDSLVLVQELSAGFGALQDEYEKLYTQHQLLERKLATAREQVRPTIHRLSYALFPKSPPNVMEIFSSRSGVAYATLKDSQIDSDYSLLAAISHATGLEDTRLTPAQQYNELAKLHNSEQAATPPLSLSSSPGQPIQEVFAPRTVAEILDRRPDLHAKDAANKVRSAVSAAHILKSSLPLDTAAHGVKIWSGPSADKPEASTSVMPSISESPLEQDFTVKGKPSQLGCPFATMARKKKLSSHAASVLSRYEKNGPTASGTASTSVSHTSHVNGRDSLSRRSSRRASMVDPIKAEICGLSDHHSAAVADSPTVEKAPSRGPTVPQIENAEAGVCPIRFLDQHSPEEVATYFEKHKNELPRSHEVCILRYQSNEEQIKQLDAKYGNLVSMIQGLGERHKEMLPEEPEADTQDEERHDDAVSEEKIRKWASSVSAQAPDAGDVVEESQERLPHFERPVREIRVGESPSRPWGIPVPAKYQEKAESDRSSQPVQVAPSKAMEAKSTKPAQEPAGKCPFDREALQAMGVARPGAREVTAKTSTPAGVDSRPEPLAETLTPKETVEEEEKDKAEAEAGAKAKKETQTPQIVVNGPVFIGYSPEDAIKILRESGLNMS